MARPGHYLDGYESWRDYGLPQKLLLFSPRLQLLHLHLFVVKILEFNFDSFPQNVFNTDFLIF